MQRSFDSPARVYAGPPIVAAVVQALGFIDLVATPVGVLLALGVRAGSDRPFDLVYILLLAGAFVAGVTLGGLLLGLAALIRYASEAWPNRPGPRIGSLPGRLVSTSRAIAASGKPAAFLDPESDHAGPMSGAIAPAHDDGAGALEPPDTDQVAALLREIRDLILLEPGQREAAQARVEENLQRQAAEQIIDAINLRQLGNARAMLRNAQARFGPTPTLERLTQKIEEASARREPLDFAHTKRLVEDAIRSGQWTLAERYVHGLYLNHLQSARCRQLWDDTRRARLHAHVQACVSEHHWEEALAAAREFLERFPGSVEAETLGRQIDTLQANAEIQQRKQYETRFKELVRTHRYTEALRLARRVIGQFPDSPQASALRPQIPALEKRIGV